MNLHVIIIASKRYDKTRKQLFRKRFFIPHLVLANHLGLTLQKPSVNLLQQTNKRTGPTHL